MSKIAFAAQLSKVTSLKDRTWKVEFNTQELGEDAAKLLALLMAQGWLLFSPNDDLTEKDIPETRAEAGIEGKTPGQRLRGVLYVFWEQKGKPGDWPTFYATQVERMIETVKDKLEPN